MLGSPFVPSHQTHILLHKIYTIYNTDYEPRSALRRRRWRPRTRAPRWRLTSAPSSQRRSRRSRCSRGGGAATTRCRLLARGLVCAHQLHRQPLSSSPSVQVTALHTCAPHTPSLSCAGTPLHSRTLNHTIAQASCEADLAAAEPLVAQAEAALDTLNKKDLGEMKSLKKPPPGKLV